MTRTSRRVLDVLLACYVAGALWLTFGPSPDMPTVTFVVRTYQQHVVASDAQGNPTDVAVRRWSYKTQWSSTETERGANVLLFIPAGVLALLRWRRLSAGRLLAGLVLGSVSIELLQLVFFTARHAQVINVVTNGSGAAIGVGLGVLARRRAARRARDRADRPDAGPELDRERTVTEEAGTR